MKSLRLILLILPLAGVSCTVNPFVTTAPSGSRVSSLGGSIFSKSTWEEGEITNPDGSIIKFGRSGRDEVSGVTSLAKSYATAGVAKSLSGDFLGGRKSADLTKRSIAAGKEATKQTAITTKGATDQAAIASQTEIATTIPQ